MKGVKTREHKALERHVQAGIVRLFKACGGVVYSTSQGYRRDPGGTRMTAGLPDLVAFFPRIKTLLFFECKRPGGVMTETQIRFAVQVHGLECSQVVHKWGGMDAAMAIMKAWGLVR